MKNLGKLFVFEGPDGVGKSELSTQFTNELRKRGLNVVLLSFPGKEEGTLGKLVYDFHHSPSSFGISEVAQSSVQLLHVASHLDAIERKIIPAINSGIIVVLDRYWWSTKAYGLASGINNHIIESIINLEIEAWGNLLPSRIFLINRKKPLRKEPMRTWKKLGEIYEQIIKSEQRRIKVVKINNNGSVDESVSKIIDEFEKESKQYKEKIDPQLLLDFLPKQEVKNSRPFVFSSISPAKPTIVFDTYWRFAAMRQEIFFKRFENQLPPWSEDEILNKYKFTNAYRASDRVSQYLIKNVIYEGEQSAEEIFFRTILFKLFNKIETWELLKRQFGEITYREFEFAAYDKVLIDALANKEAIYSAAYIMPSGSKTFGSTKKHRSHLKLLQLMMADEVPWRIADCKSMHSAFMLLRSYPMIGDFLAYQYITDLNYSSIINFSEMEFVIPGPGAKSGISKCFDSLGGLTETEIIKVMTDRQEIEFERLNINFKSLWGRRLQLIDCQNLFCEVDKYSRVFHPEINSSSQRIRIKQKFNPSPVLIEFWFPPKWKINSLISPTQEDFLK